MKDKRPGNEGEARTILEARLALAPHCRFIQGAKYSLVIDLENGELHRVNSSVSELLRFSEEGLSIRKILKKTRTDAISMAAFIHEMESRELIFLQHKPMVEKGAHLKNPDPTPPAELHSIWMEVTSRCNLRCIHCNAG